MRIKTTTRVLYTFDELSEEAQEKVLERLWDINLPDDWSEYVLEWQVEKLPALGFENASVHFSGFSSQGDGACFDADVNVSKALDAFLMCNRPARDFNAVVFEKWLALAERGVISAHISKVGYWNMYSHENTRDLELDCELPQRAWDKLELGKCQELLESITHDACQEVYSSLQSEYEYLQSREAVLETIEANEYEFTEDGAPA